MTRFVLARASRSLVMAGIMVLALLPAGAVHADPFGGIEFPGGAQSFADAIVHPRLGDPIPPDVSSDHYNALDALGPPDYVDGGADDGYISLGQGGGMTITFTDNALSGSDDDALDLYIFEIGALVEASFVDVSADGVTWTSVGRIEGSTRGVDIDAFGFDSTDRLSYVRVQDDPDQGGGSYPTGGADIDAVGAISSVCIIDAPVLSLSTLSDVSVTVAWTDPSGGSARFELERRRGSSGPWSLVHTVPAGKTTFTNGSLFPSTKYTYRVRAAEPDGCESAYSNELALRTAPARPMNLHAGTIGVDSVDLLWSDVSTNEEGFIVERAPATGAFTPIAGPGTSTPVGANRTEFVDRTVVDCTSYRYRLRAVRDAAQSRPTPAIRVQTKARAPHLLMVKDASSRSVFLEWSDPSGTNAGFIVQRLIDGKWTQLATLAGNQGWFSDYNGRDGIAMEEGHRYWYRVQSVCGTPDSSGVYPIRSTWATISLRTPPATPSELVSHYDPAGDTLLTWIDNSERETGFVVEYQVDGNKWVQLGTTVAASSGQDQTVSMPVEDLLPDGEYVFRVKAIGRDDTSSMYSNVAFGKV
jgi:hypothetical protein